MHISLSQTGQFERLDYSSIGGSGFLIVHLTREGNYKPPPMLTPNKPREHIAQYTSTPNLGIKDGIHREMYPLTDDRTWSKHCGTIYKIKVLKWDQTTSGT